MRRRSRNAGLTASDEGNNMKGPQVAGSGGLGISSPGYLPVQHDFEAILGMGSREIRPIVMATRHVAGWRQQHDDTEVHRIRILRR